jgi:hypothetical protein
MVIDKEIFLEVGGFFDKERCLYGEDSFLITTLFVNYPILLSKRPLLHVRTQPDGLGAQSKMKIVIRPLVEYQQLFLGKIGTANQSILKDYVSYLTTLDSKKMSQKGIAIKSIKTLIKYSHLSSFLKADIIKNTLVIIINILLSPILKIYKNVKDKF